MKTTVDRCSVHFRAQGRGCCLFYGSASACSNCQYVGNGNMANTRMGQVAQFLVQLPDQPQVESMASSMSLAWQQAQSLALAVR